MKRVLKHYFVPHPGNSYKPHFFGWKSMSLISLFAFTIFSFALGYPAIVSRIHFLADVLPAVLIDEANDNRAIYNLTPLTRNATLEAAAKEKADDMAKYSYFAHNSPTGITPWYWFTKAGYRFIYAGENLAINFTDSKAVTDAWMASPGHRANILNGNFTEIGIATTNGYYEGHPTTFVVQLFGKPIQPSPIATAPKVASADVAASEKIIEPKVVAVSEIDKFVAVKNVEVREDSGATNPNPTVKQTDSATPATQYGNLPSRVLSSPRTMLEAIYFIIAGIVLMAILMSLAVEFKRHHGKHLATGVFVLLLLVALA
jgi:hypothetical protein